MDKYPLGSKGKPEIPWKDLDTSRAREGTNTSIRCPNCADSRKKKNMKSFEVYVDATSGYGQCHHCGATSYDPEKVGGKSDKPYKKEYKLPDTTKFSDINQNVIDWFKNKRSISENTLIRWKIKNSTTWVPQIGKKRNCIAFPYYDKDTVINTKYRDAEKNFKMETGAKQILYGLNTITGHKTTHGPAETALFVEGEIDALSVYECGFKHVVSTPNGAPTVTEDEKQSYNESGDFKTVSSVNLEYLDNCIDDIKHVKTWYIAVDNDLPGIKLKNELIRRFGAEKCKVVSWGEYKDANDALCNKGINYVIDCVEKAEDVPLEKVVSCEEVDQYLQDILANGYPLGLSTGIESLDKHYRQRLSELDVHVGGANQGKSYWIFWLMLICSVRHDWKWAVYVPENSPPGEFYRIIIQMLTGKTFKKGKDNTIKKTEYEIAKEWINDHFFVVDYSDDEVLVNYEMLLEKFRELVFRKGINGCLIDPLNDLDMTRPPGVGIDEFYQKMLGKIRKFKQRYELKFHLSVHPVSDADRQTEEHPEQGKRPKVIELSEISGGSIFKNRVDNGISLYRNFYNKEVRNNSEIHVKKVKWQESVGLPTFKEFPVVIRYEPDICRFVCGDTDPIEGFFKNELYDPIMYPPQDELPFKSHDDEINAFEGVDGFDQVDDVPF